ncbi:META domain-containing protein [Burkholderiaceae bacterium FT117]|uniref:META domain-containing protein n=1 Tax=Zeimonas sediminis TaxID=2944268 RepID=UPI002342F518|nr:META domain-containing protein [Zeimonas sediminis]MCM5571227.1 META domain-containing protein [Zeimonas sediminis]
MTRRPSASVSRSVVLPLGLALSACAVAPDAPSTRPAPAGERSARAEAFAVKLRCANRELTIGYAGEQMEMRVGGERFALRPVPAASGAKFEAQGDATTVFWSRGQRAMVTLRGEAWPECRVVAHGSQAFRASGNEPGWRLEIYGPGLRFETADGDVRVFRRAGEPVLAAGKTTWTVQAADGPLTATAADLRCADTMTGMPYPKSVRIEYRGKVFVGCGGEPASLLQGAEWVVEDIGGGGVVDGSRVTLRFGDDGRVAGRASCNRYTGGYELSGEGLVVGSKMAVTKMACAPALMQQEQRFLGLLAQVRRFEIGADGALVLVAADGRRIVARRG